MPLNWRKNARIAIGKYIQIIGYLIDAAVVTVFIGALIGVSAEIISTAPDKVWNMNHNLAGAASGTLLFFISVTFLHIAAIKKKWSWLIVCTGFFATFMFVTTLTLMSLPAEGNRSLLHAAMTTAIKGYHEGGLKRDFIDDIHRNLHCCGLDSADDTSYVPFSLLSDQFTGEAVPASCCKARDPFTPLWLLSSMLEDCQKAHDVADCIIMMNRKEDEQHAAIPTTLPKQRKLKSSKTRATEAAEENLDITPVERDPYYSCEKNPSSHSAYTRGCYIQAKKFVNYYRPSFEAVITFVILFEIATLLYSTLFYLATSRKWKDHGDKKEVDPEDPTPSEEDSECDESESDDSN